VSPQSDLLDRYLRDVFPRLPVLSHYEVLGVASSADRPTIKRAYFALVAVLHPDRYFGKAAGTYTPQMAALFARCTAAYETLSTKALREAYDAQRPASAPPAPPPPPPVDPKVVAERQAAMEALRRRFEDRHGRVQSLVEAAERARAAGDLAATADMYKQAQALRPADAQLASAAAAAERAAKARLVESHRQKARLAERWGRFEDAVSSWRRILELMPEDDEARRACLEASAKVKAPAGKP
jgi:curved DNA-binding protein CbpA